MNYIKIFSDSQAALLALNNLKVSSKLVLDTINNLNQLAACTHRVELNWIKAHVGHPGNERANQLAREAEKLSTCLDNIPPSWAAFKAKLKEKIYKKWKQNGNKIQRIE